jgi:hypothetical protein
MDPITRQGFAVAAGAGGGITGDSSSNPALNGIEIRDQGQGTGWYWIQTSTMSSAKPVYVNNTDDGGGWMLVCYSNPDNQAGPYPNTFSTSSIPSSFSALTYTADRFALWYHNGSVQCSSTMRMASTTVSLVPLLANCSIGRRVVYSNPSDLVQINVGTLATGTKLSGTWTPLKGYTSMTSSVAIDAPCDWMYDTSNYWTDCGPSNDLTTNGRSGNGQGTGSWTSSQSDSVYGLANVAYTASSNRSDLQTFAQYIR